MTVPLPGPWSRRVQRPDVRFPPVPVIGLGHREGVVRSGKPPMAMAGRTLHLDRDMCNVEAVWAVRFGSLWAQPEDGEGGVLTLFSHRMAGGDSIMAYVGNYEADGSQISGNLTIMRHYYPEDDQANYKDHELRFEVALEGTISQDEITGRLVRPGKADGSFSMRKLAPLPIAKPK